MLQIRSLMECEKRERLDSRQSAETSLGPGACFFTGVNYAKVKSRPRVSFIYRGGYTFPVEHPNQAAAAPAAAAAESRCI